MCNLGLYNIIMIIVTGAYGFIGSCLCKYLTSSGYKNIVGVDDFTVQHKRSNLSTLTGCRRVKRHRFFSFLDKNSEEIEVIFHLGARTDTSEKDENILSKLNTEYSKKVWLKCSEYNIPLIYASSAATYGLGDYGYVDNHALVPRLEPLNQYGWSKQLFDLWVLNQGFTPPKWFGLKFFNVYGPNEGHKGRMASVVYHAFHQIKETGHVDLFKSHNPEFKDGQQARDFIYVKDVIKVLLWFWEQQGVESGIYNVGTGKAQTFEELASFTFKAMGINPLINYIDTPEFIRDQYQYFTEAVMVKLQNAGFTQPFISLGDGINDYVSNYLMDYKSF